MGVGKMNQRKSKKTYSMRSLAVLLVLCMILTACDNSAKRRESEKNGTPGSDNNVTVSLGTPTPDPNVYLYHRTALTTDNQRAKRVTELFDEDGNVLERRTETVDSVTDSREWELTEKTVLEKKASGEKIETTEHYVRGVLTSKDVTTYSSGDRKTTVTEYYEGEKLTMKITQTTEADVLREYEKVKYYATSDVPEEHEFIRYRSDLRAIPYEKKTGGAMSATRTYLSTDAWYLAATSAQGEFALMTVDVNPAPMQSIAPYTDDVIMANGNTYHANRITEKGKAEKTELGYAVKIHGATPWDNSLARDFILYFEDAGETKLVAAESDGMIWKRPVTDTRELATDNHGSKKTEVLSPVSGEWYVVKEILCDSEGRIVSLVESDENGAVTKKVLSEYRTEGDKTVEITKSLVTASEPGTERWFVLEKTYDTASGRTVFYETRIETGGTKQVVKTVKYEYDEYGRVNRMVERDEEGTELETTYINEYRKYGK